MSASVKTKKRKVSTTDDEASFSDESASTSSVSGKFPCNRCDKSFVTAQRLCGHHRVHSPHRKPYECVICDYKSAKEDNLNTHIRRKHKQELKVNPDVSAHKRINAAVLSAEAQELGLRDPSKDRPAKGFRFRCTVIDCLASFFDIAHLRSHHREHAHLYPYACTFGQCLRTFATPNELHRHIRVSHHLSDLDLVNYVEVLQPVEANEQKNKNEMCHEIDQFLRDVFPFSQAKRFLDRIINYNPDSIEDKVTFLYLFLHEDLHVDLPDWETNIISRLTLFKRFILLVAYIGKGGEGRPEQHLNPTELKRDATSAAGMFFKELISKKKKIIILKSTYLSNASASCLESCVIGSMKKGTTIVNTNNSGAKKASELVSPTEGNLASVLELYIIFLKYLNCTDEQVDAVIRQHTNVDEDFTHSFSTPEQPDFKASDRRVKELESTIDDLKAQLQEAESANQQLLANITDMDEQRNALRGKLERAAETMTKQTEEIEHLKAKVLALEERQQKSTTTINQSPAIVNMEEDYSLDDDDFEQFDWSVLETVTDAATADNDYTSLLETDIELLENLPLPEQQVP